MAALIEGQFSLDGYLFGTPTDEVVVLTGGWDLGEYDIRTQDVPSPLGDTLMMGRDYLTPPVWTFTLGVRHTSDVYAVLGQLAAAWRADTMRTVPGAISELQYCRNGETRAVYGRPRKFTILPDDIADASWKVVTATFQLADALSYGADVQELTLGIPSTSTSVGIVFPVIFPVTFASSGGTRQGIINLAADFPLPFLLTINGPITGAASNFSVKSSDGWRMDFPVSLTTGKEITVDTSTGTALLNGASIGAVSRYSSYRARLIPGVQEITFSANDPSATSTAVLQWRDVSATI